MRPDSLNMIITPVINLLLPIHSFHAGRGVPMALKIWRQQPQQGKAVPAGRWVGRAPPRSLRLSSAHGGRGVGRRSSGAWHGEGHCQARAPLQPHLFSKEQQGDDQELRHTQRVRDDLWRAHGW